MNSRRTWQRRSTIRVQAYEQGSESVMAKNGDRLQASEGDSRD